jgi:hypothetical protein
MATEVNPLVGVDAVADATDVTDVQDTDVQDTTDVADADASSDQTDADASNDAATDDKQDAKDAKPLTDAKLTSYLKELSKTDPAAAKAIRHDLFENKAFKAVYPTAAEAQAAKDSLSLFDTVEAETADGESLTGVAAAEQIVQDMFKMDAALEAGEPWAIEGIAKQFPKGFVKLIPEAVDLMQQMDKPAYNRMMCGVIANTFANTGFFKLVEEAYGLLKAGKGPDAAEKIEKFYSWMEGIAKVAEAAQKEEIPAEVKEARELIANTKKENAETFRTSLATDITAQSNQILSREIDTNFKNMKLSDAQKKRIAQNVNNDVAAMLKADKKFQSQRAAFLKAGNKQKALDFFMARMRREIPEAVARVKSELYGVAATRKAGPVAGNKPPAGKVEGELPMLTAMPPKEKIDPRTYNEGIWNGNPPKVWLKGEAKPRVLKLKK